MRQIRLAGFALIGAAAIAALTVIGFAYWILFRFIAHMVMGA